jgi:hypothetical protein
MMWQLYFAQLPEVLRETYDEVAEILKEERAS